MSRWMDKLIGMHTCWNCQTKMNKKQIYSVDVDTADGPLNLKMCQICAKDVDDMLKDLEETIAERKNTF